MVMNNDGYLLMTEQLSQPSQGIIMSYWGNYLAPNLAVTVNRDLPAGAVNRDP